MKSIFIIISMIIFSPFVMSSAPMLDGNCEEYFDKNLLFRENISKEVELFIFESTEHVWICYSMPDLSMGMLDLFVNSPLLKSAINLHVSSQLGEWNPQQPDSKPKEPNSSLWWNNIGWVSNPMKFNGTFEQDGKIFPRFLPFKARELQLSKKRFGSGEWSLKFEINTIFTESGYKTLIFPEKGYLVITPT